MQLEALMAPTAHSPSANEALVSDAVVCFDSSFALCRLTVAVDSTVFVSDAMPAQTNDAVDATVRFPADWLESVVPIDSRVRLV